MFSPTSRQVIAGLQRTPLLSISEMRAALDADRAAHGIYAWWPINSKALPAVPTTKHPVEPVGLIYVGIGQDAQARSGSCERVLEIMARTRDARRYAAPSLRFSISGKAGASNGLIGRSWPTRTTMR
jgi:hypothetical protein